MITIYAFILGRMGHKRGKLVQKLYLFLFVICCNLQLHTAQLQTVILLCTNIV